MPRASITLTAAVLASVIGAGGAALFQPSSSWQVRYSPHGGCAELATRTIGEAKESVRVWSYSFTSKPIADALIKAHQRGVDVQMVIDAPSASAHDSMADELSKAGVPVFADHKHKIMHMKAMVIDGKALLVGSFNWTHAAEDGNAESLLRIDDVALAARYIANWNEHRDHSVPFAP